MVKLSKKGMEMKIRTYPPSGRERLPLAYHHIQEPAPAPEKKEPYRVEVPKPVYPWYKIILSSANYIKCHDVKKHDVDAEKIFLKLEQIRHVPYPYRYDRLLLAELVKEFYNLLPPLYPLNNATYNQYLIDEGQLLLELRDLGSKIMKQPDWGCPAACNIKELLDIETHYKNIHESRQKHLAKMLQHQRTEPIQIFIPQLLPSLWHKAQENSF